MMQKVELQLIILGDYLLSLCEDYFTIYIPTVVANVLFADIGIKIIIINDANSGITADHSGQ